MIILDSSAVIEILKGTEAGSAVLKNTHEEQVFHTALTLQEVLLGTPNIEKVIRYFNSSEILGFEKHDAITSVEIERDLTKKGTKINKLDIMIAAMCINRSAMLVTLDKDFQKIERLRMKLVKS